MTDNNISFLGKNNKNNDKKNVSDKNINSDTIENISNKNTVLDAADKKNISGKTTTLSAAAKSKQTQTDQNYHQQVSLRDTKKLREQLKELPTFCKDFFRGIEPKTTTKTRMGYASDLRTFFRFLLSATSINCFPASSLLSLVKPSTVGVADVMATTDLSCFIFLSR